MYRLVYVVLHSLISVDDIFIHTMSDDKLTLIHAIAAKYVMGEKVPTIVFEGTRRQIEVLGDVINASKELRESINAQTPEFSVIQEKLDNKRRAALEFENCFYRKWFL